MAMTKTAIATGLLTSAANNLRSALLSMCVEPYIQTRNGRRHLRRMIRKTHRNRLKGTLDYDGLARYYQLPGND